MEKFEKSQTPKKPEMDKIDREAHEMFMENATNKLQEALQIDRAVKLIDKWVDDGVLNPQMTIEEMIDVLENKKEELIGGDALEEGGDNDEDEKDKDEE